MGEALTSAEAAAGKPAALDIPGLGVLASGDPASEHTVVYLHGWGASKELWWNTLAGMAGVTRGYALDLPGTGNTPQGPGLESMARMVEWAHGACGRLGIRRAVLVGHSLGGNLAVQMALDYPDFAAGVVLVDAALDTPALPIRVHWTTSPLYGLLAIRAMKVAVAPLAHAGKYVPHNHRGGFWGPLARRSTLLVSANKSDAALRMQTQLLCANPITTARMRSVQAPIMMVHGGLDDVIPASTARRYASEVGCPIHVFPRSHHTPIDHDPPAFIALLSDFVSNAWT
ncbi:MAG: alpha/beta fold hydrolase [Capsulimonadaceae bacterium]